MAVWLAGDEDNVEALFQSQFSLLRLLENLDSGHMLATGKLTQFTAPVLPLQSLGCTPTCHFSPYHLSPEWKQGLLDEHARCTMLKRMVQRQRRDGSQSAQGGELELIDAIRQRAHAAGRGRALRLGIGDDCAILQPPAGHELLVTTDMSLETRHFLREVHPAVSVGHRCLARGLSDLAAMGAKPLAAFLSLALPADLRRSARGRLWVNGFLSGLLDLAHAANAPLAGGDTSAAPGKEILADIVLTGSAPTRTSLRRSGARAGDLLYVTGALGGSAAELALLRQDARGFRDAAPDADHPHLFPRPRLQTGWVLRSRGLASAAIDVSDGLSTDLHHLCAASGVGAVVDAEALPVHPLARSAGEAALALALHGGEEYELLFAARPTARMPQRVGSVAVRRIGRFTAAKEVLLKVGGRTEALQARGWEHGV